MIEKSTLSMLFGLLSVSAAAVCFIEPSKENKALIIPAEFDAGTTRSGADLEFKVPVFADTAFRVISVKGDCSCLVIRPSAYSFSKGETGFLEVKWSVPEDSVGGITRPVVLLVELLGQRKEGRFQNIRCLVTCQVSG